MVGCSRRSCLFRIELDQRPASAETNKPRTSVPTLELVPLAEVERSRQRGAKATCSSIPRREDGRERIDERPDGRQWRRRQPCRSTYGNTASPSGRQPDRSSQLLPASAA